MRRRVCRIFAKDSEFRMRCGGGGSLCGKHVNRNGVAMAVRQSGVSTYMIRLPAKLTTHPPRSQFDALCIRALSSLQGCGRNLLHV